MRATSTVSTLTAAILLCTASKTVVDSQLISNEEAKCKALDSCEACETEPFRCQWCGGAENVCHTSLNFMKFQCSLQSSCPSNDDEDETTMLDAADEGVVDACKRAGAEKIPVGDVAFVALAAACGVVFAITATLYAVSRCGSPKKNRRPSSSFSETADLRAGGGSSGEHGGGVDDDDLEFVSTSTSRGIEMSSTFASRRPLGNNDDDDRRANEFDSNNNNNGDDGDDDDLALYDESRSPRRGAKNNGATSPSSSDAPSRMVPTLRSSFRSFLWSGRRWFGVAALVSFAGAVAFSVVVLRPKEPTVNICSTKVIWREMLLGPISSGKLEAPFDLVLSVRNPNELDADVDLRNGVINYDDGRQAEPLELGTFDLEALRIKANTIADVTANVTVYPTRVDRPLLMMEQFLSNTLKFQVAADLKVTLPSLFNIKFSRNWADTINFALVDVTSLLRGQNDLSHILPRQVGTLGRCRRSL